MFDKVLKTELKNIVYYKRLQKWFSSLAIEIRFEAMIILVSITTSMV